MLLAARELFGEGSPRASRPHCGRDGGDHCRPLAVFKPPGWTKLPEGPAPHPWRQRTAHEAYGTASGHPCPEAAAHTR